MTPRVDRNRWDLDERFQRCRACGARFAEYSASDAHVREGATLSLESLCRGTRDLVTRYHDGETGAELERSMPLGG